ncbi:MAG: UDP-N-acetylmuramoyl-L-alanyl-D-glutamate--2,6-diaminopimelate ligase [Mycobacteriales bacterium]
MPAPIAPLRPARPAAHPLGAVAARLDRQTAGVAIDAAEHVLVTGIAHAAAAVVAGDLFIARAGSAAHGADYATEAARRGAVAVLTDPAGAARARASGLPVLVENRLGSVIGPLSSWIYGDPSRQLAVLGVTGTSGKTTTTFLLEAGLRHAGMVTGLLGTVETRIAGRTEPSVRTTPEAPELQAALAVMLERGATAVAMEVSSHALVLGRVDGTRFASAGFSNLSAEHLDFHADMDDYFAAKALLFDGRSAAEVVNVDDPWGRRLVGPGTVTVSAAGAAGARWRAGPIGADDRGSSFAAVGPDGGWTAVTLGLPGRFNVDNALLALAMLDTVGVPVAEAAAAFAAVRVPGRLERVDGPGTPIRAYVDYAHKPAALEAVIAALRPSTSGQLIVVVGCGGDRDRAKRPMMGDVAARGSDLVIITDDNPRSEDPTAIRSEIESGARAAGAAPWTVVGDRGAAIAEAVRRARAGDTVLVAGKGHEQGQEVAGTVRPFDDRMVLRAALADADAADPA